MSLVPRIMPCVLYQFNDNAVKQFSHLHFIYKETDFEIKLPQVGSNASKGICQMLELLRLAPILGNS
jgi:hypothetical protein